MACVTLHFPKRNAAISGPQKIHVSIKKWTRAGENKKHRLTGATLKVKPATRDS